MDDQSDVLKIYTVDLSGKKLKEVPQIIKEYKNCKSVDLACNHISMIKSTDFSGCTQLKELRLYDNQIKDLKNLQKLTKLEELLLQYNHITCLSSSLSSLKSLKLLRIDNNRLSTLKYEELCHLNNLTYLDISCNKLQDLTALSVLNSLQELICTHNSLTNLPDLRSLKRLRQLDISYNKISDLRGLKHVQSLTVLNIDHNSITSLTSLGKHTSLEDLKVNSNQLSDLKHICTLFPSLEILEMNENNVTSTQQLEYLLQLQSLKELTLNNNPVILENQGKERLLHIAGILNLDYLDKIVVKKNIRQAPPNLMRPLSANQMMSTRLIEEQLNHTQMSLDNFNVSLQSQFNELFGKLTVLPEEKDQAKKLGTSTSNNSSTNRPSSRCSSRARLEDAISFAARNVFTEEY